MRAQPETIVVIGGGLAGLAGATYLARAGHRVRLYERAAAVGGRALTQTEAGFAFNIGPHALYRGGPAMEVLRELGVTFHGASPNASGGYVLRGGSKHALPGGFVSLLTTGLLSLSAKLETARLLSNLAKIETTPLQGTSVRQWVERAVRHSDLRQLIEALIRLSTYANAAEQQSAGAALAQLQAALAKNVLYLDDGWQTLVDGLRQAAIEAGVAIITGTRVEAIEPDGAAQRVRLAGGPVELAAAVLIAAGPSEAAALLPANAAVRQWAAASLPVKAACLDIGLRALPRPRARFALGVDQPIYFSVHSAYARLAPAGGAAVIHVAKYLDPKRSHDAKADERELEGVLDLVQPGWRSLVVERRFLPGMTVAHAVVTAAAGGISGRPSPAVPGTGGVLVAGDWVGPEGMLADASLASARAAARQIAEMFSTPAAA